MISTHDMIIALGIDLGTTTSQMVIMDESGVERILANLDGDLITLSIVSVSGSKPIVGKAALQDKFLNPDKVAEQFKKLMDRVNDTDEPIPLITASDGTEYTPITLSAEVLHYLKVSAEKLLGRKIIHVVVSVPAFFKGRARQATKDAIKISGFEEVIIVDEPTAAATFYGLAKGQDSKISVLDFGGGTFDNSILEVKDNGQINPIAIDGNPECGGCTIDEIIFQEARQFVEQKGGQLSPEKDLAEWLEVLDACKQAKEVLARKDKAVIPLRIGNERTSMELTYDHLKELSAPVIKIIKNCCQRALEKGHLTPSDIDKVLLVGGSSRLRFMTEIVKDIYGQEPVTDTDPDFAVAKGNAIIAAAKFGPSDQLINIDGHKYLASVIKTRQIAARPLCVAAFTDKDEKNERNVQIIPAGAQLPYNTKENFTPIEAGTHQVAVKLIDGEPDDISSNYTPLEEVEVDVQPTDESNNRDRIEFLIVMDEEALVDIKVRDKLLDKPVPIKFRFHAGLSDKDIEQKRKQLRKRHK